MQNLNDKLTDMSFKKNLNINKSKMNLSRYTLKNIQNNSVQMPDESVFDLPEKVLQFGTGVLLRGLPDYYIDNANRNGIFNGRIVMVKSTSQGDTTAFEKQDCLYTLCVRGLKEGLKVEENIINASVSRIINASTEWEQVLECARNPQLQIIVSNTTEVGIQLVKDDIRHHPPKSFPGKLLAFLYKRFQVFGGTAETGMVIIPTELIPDNGKVLESIVLELAHLNGLEDAFIEWIENHNSFCNSLVDRIVPGKPAAELLAANEASLGYTDELQIMSEVYNLWAIEGDEHVKNILSFAKANEGVIIEPDIAIYRELKLRLLNGTHTLSCGVAFLYGCPTVSQAMEDETLETFISNLMQREIAPSIPYDVDLSVAKTFGNQVLERFKNPYVNHHWINITMQYSSKMKLRCIPVLTRHYQQHGTVPELFALGFAAYIYFMKPVRTSENKFYGEINGTEYLIQDDQASVFYGRWAAGLSMTDMVKEVVRDQKFWEEDLQELPGFEEAVIEKLNWINDYGIKQAIANTATRIKNNN